MRRAVLAALLVSPAFLPAGAAVAAPPSFVEGPQCGFVVLMSEPTDDPGVWSVTAEMDGGPVAVADVADLVANPVAITLTCTFQLDYETHADPDTASASGSGIAVATVAPTLFRYEDHEASSFTLCTQVTVTNAHGETYDLYWDADAQEYSTSDTVPCTGPFTCEFLDCWPWTEVFQLVEEHGEPAVCSAIAAAAPGVPGVVDIGPTGDVHVAGEFVWDCPPYEDESVDPIGTYQRLWSELVQSPVCSVLAGLAPGVPGVVDIDPYGRTVVAGLQLWYCAP